MTAKFLVCETRPNVGDITKMEKRKSMNTPEVSKWGKINKEIRRRRSQGVRPAFQIVTGMRICLPPRDSTESFQISLPKNAISNNLSEGNCGWFLNAGWLAKSAK